MCVFSFFVGFKGTIGVVLRVSLFLLLSCFWGMLCFFLDFDVFRVVSRGCLKLLCLSSSFALFFKRV